MYNSIFKFFFCRNQTKKRKKRKKRSRLPLPQQPVSERLHLFMEAIIF